MVRCRAIIDSCNCDALNLRDSSDPIGRRGGCDIGVAVNNNNKHAICVDIGGQPIHPVKTFPFKLLNIRYPFKDRAMFSPLAQRLAARLGISSGRSHIASKPSILSQTRRSFVTTSPRTFPAAAAKPTTKKPATKKPAVKKLVAKATKAKATAPKTVAAKKPTATKAKPKRRVAAKKPAAKKPTREWE